MNKKFKVSLIIVLSLVCFIPFTRPAHSYFEKKRGKPLVVLERVKVDPDIETFKSESYYELTYAFEVHIKDYHETRFYQEIIDALWDETEKEGLEPKYLELKVESREVKHGSMFDTVILTGQLKTQVETPSVEELALFTAMIIFIITALTEHTLAVLILIGLAIVAGILILTPIGDAVSKLLIAGSEVIEELDPSHVILIIIAVLVAIVLIKRR